MASPAARPSISRAACVLGLIAILVVAAGLRVWGLDQCLPHPNARPDERELLERTAGFPAGDLNPRWAVYPNLFFWVVWLWVELVLALTRLVAATPDYATLLTTDLARVVLTGRALSALVGTATVGVVYAVGRRIGGRQLGLVAAILLATNFLHVRDSHALKTESFVALGTLVAIELLARFAERHDLRRAVAAGVAIGVTTALKYNGILLLFAAWIADVLGSSRRGLARVWPSGALLAVAGAAIATFLVGSPYLLLDAARTRDTIAFVTPAAFTGRPQPTAGAGGGLAAIAHAIGARAFGYHLTVSLRRGCGLAFAVATPLAIALGLRARRPPFLFLAATFSLFYYAVIGVSFVELARYLTPIVPLLVLLVAHLVTELSATVSRPAWRTAALVVLVVGLVAEPVASAIAYDRIASRTDTRVLATRWMAEHLPPDAVVAELGTIVFPLADPVLPPGVTRAPLALGETDLARHGVTHVVTHEHPLPFSRLVPAQVAAIAPHLRLLATFSPFRDGPAGGFEPEDAFYVPFFDFDGVERPGPLVRIYAFDPAGGPPA